MSMSDRIRLFQLPLIWRGCLQSLIDKHHPIEQGLWGQDYLILKFCKPLKITFALKPVVGDELDCLENQGVIKKVPHSYWATPIVVVRKPGDKVCIMCGDFKITNLVLKTNMYPQPEELFQSLNGGSKFSKIDPADAWL